MLIDTHTHLYFDEYSLEKGDVVKKAIEAGVGHMVLPGVNSSTIEPIKSLHKLFPDNTSMAIGLHPSDVTPENVDLEIEIIKNELEKEKGRYVALGETGIDLHLEKENLDLQQQSFERQIQLAIDHSLPLILHSRDAFEATYEVLDSFGSLPPMIFHSFTGEIKDAENILSRYDDVYFGLNGIITFKNSNLKSVLPVIPDQRLLLETDSPYLAPVPHRGQTNESSFLVYIARFIASEKNIGFEDLAQLTTANAKRFFGI